MHERGTPVAAQERGVAGGGIGDESADVGLAVERGDEGVEDLAGRSGVEPGGAFERDGEELADRAGEPLVQQLFGAGGLGLALRCRRGC